MVLLERDELMGKKIISYYFILPVISIILMVGLILANVCAAQGATLRDTSYSEAEAEVLFEDCLLTLTSTNGKDELITFTPLQSGDYYIYYNDLTNSSDRGLSVYMQDSYGSYIFSEAHGLTEWADGLITLRANDLIAGQNYTLTLSRNEGAFSLLATKATEPHYEVYVYNISIDVDEETAPIYVYKVLDGVEEMIPQDQVDWSVDSSSVASVSSNGVIKGESFGETYVFAKYVNPNSGKQYDFKIDVTVETTSYSLSDESVSLLKGDNYQIKLRITVDGTYTDISNTQIQWSSSDSAVASVNSGNITAKKSGTTTITAVYEGQEYQCVVTVLEATYSLSETRLALTQGGSSTLTLKQKVGSTESTVSNTDITWKSSNTSVATVDKYGRIKALKSGSTTITATYDAKQYICTVTVEANQSEETEEDNAESESNSAETVYTAKKATVKYKLSKTSTSIYAGKTLQLKLKKIKNGTTSNVGNSKITWKSSKTGVATVSSSGKVTAKKAGTTTISAKYNGKTYKCKLTIKAKTTSSSSGTKTYTVGYGTKAISLTGKLVYVTSTHIGNGQKIDGYILKLSKPVKFKDTENNSTVKVDSIQVQLDTSTFKKYEDKTVTLKGSVEYEWTAWYLRDYYMKNAKVVSKTTSSTSSSSSSMLKVPTLRDWKKIIVTGSGDGQTWRVTWKDFKNKDDNI
jgi:uncharacterized protein YjdB